MTGLALVLGLVEVVGDGEIADLGVVRLDGEGRAARGAVGADPSGFWVPAELPYTMTVSLRLPPVPWMVTCGLFDGTFTTSRYVPGLTEITTREALLAGTAFTAACTVLYWPEPSAATVSVVAAAAVVVAAVALATELRGPTPDLRSAGTSAALSRV